MNESNDNLAEALRFVAELTEETNDARCPSVRLASQSTPQMLLDDTGKPIVMGGEAVDFDHLVELSKVVHPATLEVSTLQAVVDWFKGGKGAGHFVQISSSLTVSVRADDVRVDGGRDNALKSSFSAPSGHFGEWMPVDEFSTWLLSGFVPNDDSEALYEAIGRSVKYEAAREAADGKRGTEFKTSEGTRVEWSEGSTGPRFMLGYICTFPEVSQPERACVFRHRNVEDGIQIKLVDADGGAWRTKAIASIADWLKGHDELKGVTILG